MSEIYLYKCCNHTKIMFNKTGTLSLNIMQAPSMKSKIKKIYVY